jgi:hypothetical protein
MPDGDPATPTAEPTNPATPEPGTTPPATPDASPPNGELGDAGKAALEAERKARRDAERTAREATAELDRIRQANLTDQEKAVDAARREGESVGARRILEAEIRAAAAGKLANPALAARLLDLDELMPTDGADVDGERIAKAIEDLVIAEPYLAATPAGFTPAPTPPAPPAGTAPGGARGTGSPASFSRSQLRDPEFYAANKDAILKAAAEGRITND